MENDPEDAEAWARKIYADRHDIHFPWFAVVARAREIFPEGVLGKEELILSLAYYAQEELGMPCCNTAYRPGNTPADRAALIATAKPL